MWSLLAMCVCGGGALKHHSFCVASEYLRDWASSSLWHLRVCLDRSSSGSLLLYEVPHSVIRHLSLFECFLLLYQTRLCPFGPYRVIQIYSWMTVFSLLGDQFLVSFWTFLRCNFTCYYVPHVISWSQTPTYPVCTSVCRLVWQYLS